MSTKKPPVDEAGATKRTHQIPVPLRFEDDHDDENEGRFGCGVPR